MLIEGVEEVKNVNDFKKKALEYWNGVESTVDGKQAADCIGSKAD